MPRPKAQTAALLASPDDVEAQFYEALQHADLDRLMALWSDDDEVACVHPGGPRVIGHAGIRASFEAIFANGAIPVQLHSVKRVQSLGSAVHHVVEHISVQTDKGAHSAWIASTNVYLKTAQGWRLLVHHASAGSERSEAAGDERPGTLH
ncbi:MAG: nuclear transport factor 2 family protein [Rubrivivax sp.]